VVISLENGVQLSKKNLSYQELLRLVEKLDMRYGYTRTMEVIRMSYHQNPYKGDVFFFMSKNERSVRMVMYDKHTFNVYTCYFVKEYRFVKIRFEEEKVHLSRKSSRY